MKILRKLFKTIQLGSLFMILVSIPKKQKVVHFVNSLDHGGLEQVVIDLHLGLISENFESRICVWTDSVSPIVDQIEDFSQFQILASSEKEFLRFLIHERPKYIHYHHSTVGVKYLKFARIKSFYTLHNIYTWLDYQQGKEFFAQLSRFNVVIAVSKSVAHYYKVRAELVGARIPILGIIENGVEYTRVPIKPLINNPISALEILMVANFYPTKALFGVFGLIQKCNNLGLNVNISIAGAPSDREYYNDFINQLKNFELKNQIKILGLIEHSKVIELFTSGKYHAMMSLSLQEGCSISLLEGIGAGLPVITTRTGNVPEVELLSKSILVIPNQYKNNLSLQPQEILQLGRVTSPGNLEELVEAIIMLSGNLNELTNIARSNACQFRELYGLLRFVGDHSKLYREGLLPEYST